MLYSVHLFLSATLNFEVDGHFACFERLPSARVSSYDPTALLRGNGIRWTEFAV